jgi:RNA methyltransferase, TrmH family
MSVIKSRDNARVKRWAKLVSDSSARRSEKRVIVEGAHLVGEALQSGLKPLAFIVSESGLQRPEIRRLVGKHEPVVLGDHIFGIVADAETPPGIAVEIDIPNASGDPKKPGVFLEGIQDPSNVGAILRTAAAFGIGEVVLDQGCADAWSSKALRAAMGGHFKLALRRVADLANELDGFQGRIVCTVSTRGLTLNEADLTGRLGWIFGAEGQGVSEATAAKAAVRVTIPMAPGTESLNVAAAAAVCLYAGFTRRNSGSGS